MAQDNILTAFFLALATTIAVGMVCIVNIAPLWSLPGIPISFGLVALLSNLMALMTGPRVALAMLGAATLLGFELPFAIAAGVNLVLLAICTDE